MVVATDVRYRITATVPGQGEVLMERFADRAGADAMWASLQEERDNILYALPWQAMVVLMEELHEGTWVPLGRRVVVRRRPSPTSRGPRPLPPSPFPHLAGPPAGPAR